MGCLLSKLPGNEMMCVRVGGGEGGGGGGGIWWACLQKY